MMGWRFRKSVKILPGVRLNFSRSGISTSLGGPGATLNLGRGKRTLTTGIPGTGLSHSQSLMGGADAAPPTSTGGSGCAVWIGAIVIGLFALSMCRSPEVQSPAPVAKIGTVETPEVAAQPVETLYVDTPTLNVRSDASTQSSIVARLQRGDPVQVVERRDEWSKIVQGAAFAWVATRYLSDKVRAAPIPAANRSRPQSLIRSNGGGRCPCSSNQVCIGPRGGRYCITGNGNKRYGV